MRHHFNRRFAVARPRRKTTWARVTNNDAAPGAGTNAYDLLASYKTAAGITINLPGITLGPIHLKIAITITVTSATANTGALIGIATVDPSDVTGGGGTVSNPITSPYDLDFMVWEELYTAEQLLMAGVDTTAVLYKELHVKSMRKLRGQAETLALFVTATGNATLTGVSFTGQTLLRLP